MQSLFCNSTSWLRWWELLACVALCGTLMTEGCQEGSTGYCTECIYNVLSNVTDMEIYTANETNPCPSISNSSSTSINNIACIMTADSGENTKLISVKFYAFEFVHPNLINLQIAMIEFALANKQPLCSVSELAVVAVMNSPLMDGPHCYNDVIERDVVLAENTTFPSEFSFEESVIVRKEYLYSWTSTGYKRNINYITCLSCSPEVIVFSSDDDININDGLLEVPVSDGKIANLDFIALENGSFVVCPVPEAASPLASRIPVTITVTLVIISLLSLIITFLTYCAFSELRNLPGQIVMNFLIALFIALLSVLFDRVLPAYDTACAVAGAVFHYFWLSSFFWMNALSINTTITITRNMPMIKPTGHKKLLMYMTYGWGAPVIVLIISLALHFCDCTDIVFSYGLDAYVDDSVSCWIGGDDLAGIILYTLVVTILLGINVILFIYTLYKVRKVTEGIRSQQQKGRKTSHMEYRVFIKLTFLMGLPWLLEEPAKALQTLLLEYIFVILNALQGFFVFIVLVVTSRARQMWLSKLRKMGSSPSRTQSSVI